MEPWFKPLAYAAILLRNEGYPCVFYPDYYGAEYEDFGRDGQRHRVVLPSLRGVLDQLLWARRHVAWGPQVEYPHDAHRVGWVRLGDDQHRSAMAVVMSDGEGGNIWMDLQRPAARMVDITGHVPQPVETNPDGWGDFPCQGGSVSVWVEQSLAEQAPTAPA
ncbi:MAG: hypothetical protein U0795_11270 [Pirellulales bacterium]